MKVCAVELYNYRNYAAQSVTVSPAINIFLGRNAQGKTNILEGIWYAALGRSHRAKNDGELIRWAEKKGRLFLRLDRKSAVNTLEFRFFKGQRRQIFHNGQEIARVNTREYLDKDGKESDKYDIEVAYEEGVYTGNQEIPYEKEAPGVYPTKIGNDALLHLTNSSSVTAVSIYTVDGVLLKKVEHPSASISVEDLAAGNTYIVVLDGNAGRSVHRIFR